MKSNTEMSKQIDLEKLKSRMLDALSGKGFNNAATCGEVLELLDHIAALEKENASLKQDAARYRWLRDENTDVALVIDKRTNYTPSSDDGLTGGYWDYEYRCGSELDEAIDTAMEASNAKAD